MKTCPKCKELVGDNVESCFNCNYNFILKGCQVTRKQSSLRKMLQLRKRNGRGTRGVDKICSPLRIYGCQGS